ncbi:4-hydroxy-tetrahydrodipicolinate synthase [Piscinibacter terrae]|uniref:4-hydroxy-tetrahydrodipicolinate synthase n=1 Tax=Piscinibacter terrae TaxID=2496871 RepID=A0A3N7HSV6_9BURK|nr:4-hydroxy-tetrahydrodipicolinate synthase [Albitalea terrae]RQP23921.1 4-hydroxy-tetrahydrodipicolinate synthase [Albitalea terrae]
MSDWSGIWVAIVTPFLNDGPRSVDHAGLKRLVRRCKSAGVKGLVALGSTGEPWALDDAEQVAVLDTILASGDGLPVIAGLGGNHVGQMHARLAAFNGLPLAGVISSPPPYARPSQPALVQHFERLADLSRAPLLLYDIPYRTGVAMELPTILALAAHRNIAGIKDCGGSAAKTQALIQDGRLAVLAGEDAQAFGNLCLGGAGAITAAANVRPEAFVAMFHALQRADLPKARPIQHALLPLIDALFSEPNPALVKAALQAQGLIADAVRAPLIDASDAGRARVLQALEAFDAQVSR